MTDTAHGLRGHIVETAFDELEKLAGSCLVDPTEPVPEPPVLIYIEQDDKSIPICTAGNFSVVIGKAKSRKTFLVSSLVAAAISGSGSLVNVGSNVPDNGTVLLFDTEQSAFHVQRTVKRILSQTGHHCLPNFMAYRLRTLAPAQRLQVIDYLINKMGNLSLVVIDGIRDLLTNGINDESEATALTTKFLQWTGEKNIHLITVLHQNKNDQNARGHIGTEVVNKAEAIISVAKETSDLDISTVAAEYCRDIDFKTFHFSIDENGWPVLSEYSGDTTSAKDAQIKDNLQLIVKSDKKYTYTHISKEYANQFNCAERTAKRHINRGLQNNIIQVDKSGLYELYKIDPKHDLPF